MSPWRLRVNFKTLLQNWCMCNEVTVNLVPGGVTNINRSITIDRWEKWSLMRAGNFFKCHGSQWATGKVTRKNKFCSKKPPIKILGYKRYFLHQLKNIISHLSDWRPVQRKVATSMQKRTGFIWDVSDFFPFLWTHLILLSLSSRPSNYL